MVGAKAKAKSKKAPKALRALIDNQVKTWKAQTEARYRIGMAHYEAQDADTRQVIEWIRDRIVAYSTGVMKFYPNGKLSSGAVAVEVEAEYVDYNALYMATEILKDLALLDVKIANYQFPELVCGECGNIMAERPRRRRAKERK